MSIEAPISVPKQAAKSENLIGRLKLAFYEHPFKSSFAIYEGLVVGTVIGSALIHNPLSLREIIVLESVIKIPELMHGYIGWILMDKSSKSRK